MKVLVACEFSGVVRDAFAARGHGEKKATCLWLKDLPPLKPTNIVAGRSNRIHMMPDTKARSLKRSITCESIAQAMAEQWG